MDVVVLLLAASNAQSDVGAAHLELFEMSAVQAWHPPPTSRGHPHSS